MKIGGLFSVRTGTKFQKIEKVITSSEKVMLIYFDNGEVFYTEFIPKNTTTNALSHCEILKTLNTLVDFYCFYIIFLIILIFLFLRYTTTFFIYFLISSYNVRNIKIYTN